MSHGIQQSMMRGAAWMLMFKLLDRSLALVSTLVLVRILAPEDFGIVAMAVSFIAMAELLSAFGFDLALIHNQNASADHYHTAWTCNVLLGAFITVVLIASAKPIAAFYNRPDVFWVVCVLGLGATIGGLENVGIVAFRKELAFRNEFGFLLSKKLIGVLVTVPLAIWLRSYWALVIGTLVSRTSGTLISYLIHPFRPRFSLARLADLMVFSKWMLINSIIIVFKEKTTDFVIGSLQGPRALGLFSVSNEFATLPHTEIAAPINRALLPAFAKIQDDRADVHASFIAAIRMLALFVVPAAAGIYAIAPNLVPVVLGSKWLDAIPLMEILPIAGGLVAMHSPICALLVANGRPDSVAWSHAVYVVTLLVALFLLVPRYAAPGAAYALLAASIIATPAYLFQAKRRVGIRTIPFLQAVARPVMASAVMVLTVRGVVPVADPHTTLPHALLLLLGGIALGAVTYAAAALAIWILYGRPAGAEQVVLSRVMSMLRRRGS